MSSAPPSRADDGTRDQNLSRWNIDRIDGEVLVCRGEHEKGHDCEWERYIAEDRFLAAEARASTAEAEVARLMKEREEADKERTDMMWQRRRADERAEAAEARIAVLEAALKPFCFGDAAMEQILFGATPDSAPCNFTIKYGHLRAARAALTGGSDV